MEVNYKIPEYINKDFFIKECLINISNLSGESINDIIDRISEKYGNNMKKLTIEDIENKNYTYVTVYRRNEINYNESFLVSSPYKDRALILAKEYVKNKGWKINWTDDYHLYPRNYVKKARELFNEGKYL